MMRFLPPSSPRRSLDHLVGAGEQRCDSLYSRDDKPAELEGRL
jgi:hypothetical protein